MERTGYQHRQPEDAVTGPSIVHRTPHGQTAFCFLRPHFRRLRAEGYDVILMCPDAPAARAAARDTGVRHVPVAMRRDVAPLPRVAVVSAVDSTISLLLKGQITALQEAGYDVRAVCSDGPYVGTLRDEGIPVRTVLIPRRISLWHDVKTVVRLARLFRHEHVDIVHTHTPMATMLAQLAALLAGVPVRFNTIHGLYFYGQERSCRRWFFKTMEVFACRLATHVFSQSREDMDLLVRERLVTPEKLEWLGNGIDLDRFTPGCFGADVRCRVRAELDVPEDAFVIGIVARMVKEKGILELFEAFAAISRRVPEARLVHIGPVDTSRGEEVTPDVARRYGIGDRCRFLGQRDDVPRLMTAMDVYCLPSHREGYPRSVMEACAMGLPVVVTDIRGSREAVLNGVNGLLVPLRDPEAIAQALVRLHDDSGLRRRLSEGARARALEMFDERRVIQVILEAYERALRQR